MIPETTQSDALTAAAAAHVELVQKKLAKTTNALLDEMQGTDDEQDEVGDLYGDEGYDDVSAGPVSVRQ